MFESLFRHFDHIVFLDVETSGLNPEREEIIEFGGIDVFRESEDTYLTRETDMLVRLSDGKKLSKKITELTGISQDILEHEGSKKETLRDVLTGLFGEGKPLVVAYNAQFDLCFLYYFLKAFGSEGVMKNIKMLDALSVYKDRRDYPHKLEDAVKEYRLETKNTHRALDDAAAAYSLLCVMENECPDLERYINLFGFNPRFGISGPRISSVKYVPQPYIRTEKLYEKIKEEISIT